MLDSRVSAQARDKGFKLTDAFNRRHIALILAAIDNKKARRGLKRSARFGLGNGAFKLNADCLRMADKDRHTHACGGHLDIRVEHFLRLDNHFPFFLGRPVLHEHINMRDDIKGDLLGEVFALQLIIDEDGAGLGEQLIHRRIAGTRNRLISRDNNPLNRRNIVQRLQRHHKLRRRAIRIGNNIALRIAVNMLRINLRHDKRHILIHAIKR